ncbi:quinone oxidoreductase family protein [Streptacidiphilus anmyonensis]|uniref:quinone oxidoreductase family protein n=1 Tax=Streptacidiphilus anmyonensis TaxID=405782 RepID=UPI000693AE6F|nr:zinc-binding alcohol dehydrogenase family protein [Streptacidiphilus anmyonensis]
MRAAIVNQLGQAPRLGERPDPVDRPGHTLVRVTAAALNPVDLHIASGGHPAGTPRVPFVPGIEAAGTVISGGALTPGTRVRVAVPGGFVDGTLAELVSVPDDACLPLPDGLDDDLAAAVGVVGVSALLALREEAALRPGESVLVLGATGALGQTLVHLARALGADHVVAAGRNPDRLKALGEAADATLLVDEVPTAGDPAALAEALAATVNGFGGAVDVVIDLLWGPHTPTGPGGPAPRRTLGQPRPGGGCFRRTRRGRTAPPPPAALRLQRHRAARRPGRRRLRRGRRTRRTRRPAPDALRAPPGRRRARLGRPVRLPRRQARPAPLN